MCKQVVWNQGIFWIFEKHSGTKARVSNWESEAPCSSSTPWKDLGNFIKGLRGMSIIGGYLKQCGLKKKQWSDIDSHYHPLPPPSLVSNKASSSLPDAVKMAIAVIVGHRTTAKMPNPILKLIHSTIIEHYVANINISQTILNIFNGKMQN